MQKISQLITFLKSCVSRAVSGLDVRDVLILGGLSMLFYGIYLYCPWLAFTVCGSIVFVMGVAGYFLGGKK